MKTKKVITVSVAESSSLSSCRRLGPASITNVPASIWRKIPIEVPADLTLSSKIEDKEVLHTAKLVFRQCGEAGREMHIPVYRIRLADDSELLLGGSTRPFPVRTYSQNLSSGSNDSLLREVTVSLTSVLELPYII